MAQAGTWLNPLKHIVIHLGLIINLLHLCSQFVLAENVIVDDTDNGIIFSGNWRARSNATGCPTCTAQPDDLNAIYRRTWHEADQQSGSNISTYLQYNFEGTGITLYGVLFNKINQTLQTSGRQVNLNLTFSIDGSRSGVLLLYSEDSATYIYNQTLFSKLDLIYGVHTFRVDINPNSIIIFDYLTYTTPDQVSQITTPEASLYPPTLANLTPQSTTPIELANMNSKTFTLSHGVIFGIAVGGFTLLLVIILMVWLFFRRSRRHRQNGGLLDKGRDTKNYKDLIVALSPTPTDTRMNSHPITPSKPTPSFKIASTVSSDNGDDKESEDENESVYAATLTDESKAHGEEEEEKGDEQGYPTPTSAVITIASARYLPAPKPSRSSKHLMVPTNIHPTSLSEPNMQARQTRDHYELQSRFIA